MMNTYPENDYRNYLMHYAKGKEAKNHKYVSKHKSKSGNWVYVYQQLDSVKKAKAAQKHFENLIDEEDQKLKELDETLKWMGDITVDDIKVDDPEFRKAVYEDMANEWDKMNKDYINRKYKNDKRKKTKEAIDKMFSKR